MNYTFVLRHGVTFSNGDPFNAYVMWYSVYRTLVMAAGALLDSEPESCRGKRRGPQRDRRDAELHRLLSPSPANLTVMMNPHQSVQVINASEIQFNLGYGTNGMAPYSDFLATLETPWPWLWTPPSWRAMGE